MNLLGDSARRIYLPLALILLLATSVTAALSIRPSYAQATGASAGAATTAAIGSSFWRPALVTSWQWQLSTQPTTGSFLNVQMYDIDLFDNPAATVAALHAQGTRVVCYIDAGTWENWRPDASSFPSSVMGKSNGWPGEKWLDIRQISVLGPIMQARVALCAQKGFDGVEFDNVDGYTNPTGFPLTAQDQLNYNE